jgi:hypothetical protein
MRKSYIIFLILLIQAVSLFAQAPSKFNYQAVIRDASGAVKANETVNIQIGLLQGNITSTPIYLETQSKTTNEFGVVNLVIGEVEPIPSGIEWSQGPFFLKVWVDGAEMGTSQLLTVPYAMYSNYAKEAGNGFSGDYNDLSNKPVTDGSETKIQSGKNVDVLGAGTSADPYVIYAMGCDSSRHYIGELFGGGIVFYIDKTGAHGLVCSLVDLKPDTIWSNIWNSAIGASARSMWDGLSNSIAIANQHYHSNSAAKLCLDYQNEDYGTGVFSDWYLPSFHEWFKIYTTKYEITSALLNDLDIKTIPPELFGGYYWTSTESAVGTAWAIELFYGNFAYIEKNLSLRIRAVRKF